jgi:hypothetical protein
MLVRMLHCPICGESLGEKDACFGGFVCPYCAKISVERSCMGARSRAERAALPLGAPPEGVTLREGDDSFRCDIAKSDGIGPAVLWLTTAAMGLSTLLFLQGKSLSASEFWSCVGVGAVVVALFGIAAAYFSFATDSVLGTADTLEFRSGFRRWAMSRVVRRADLRRVVLDRQIVSDSEGASVSEFVLLCEFADGRPAFRFAAGQPFLRLAWVSRYLAEEA